MWGRLSSLPVYRTFQSGGPKTGDSKVARTRRLESLRYEPVPVRGPNAFQKEMEALHEPQGAAGILPAEDSERSSADETSAAPCWRHGSTCSRFIVLMHAKKQKEASMRVFQYGEKNLLTEI